MISKHVFILSFILFSILFSVTTIAEEGCRQPIEQSPLDSLNKHISHLHDHSQKNAISEDAIDWWSASEKMVKEAKCQQDVPTLEEIDLYFNKFPKRRKKAVIMGFKVEDESPELIAAMEDLLYKKDWSGEFKGDYKGKVPASCNKVKCIAENIFGKELGPKLLFLKQRYGFNSSEYVHPNASRVTVNEVNTLIKSASYLPAFLLPLDKNKQMTVFKRGYAPVDNSPDTVANASITFFAPWNNQSHEMKKYTAFHEMSHYVAGEFNLDENAAWLNISGWTKTGASWNRTKKDIYSSKYGVTNAWEDFAEAMSAYRFNPKLLQKASPEKYNFIKEVVFQGLEYTSEESCQDKNSYAFKLNSEKEKSKAPLPEKADATYLAKINDSAYLSCGNNIVSIMAGENDSSFRECLDRSIPLRIDSSKTDDKILSPMLKTMQHPLLVKASIEKTATNNPVRYSDQEIAKFQTKNYNDIKLNFEKESVGILKTIFKENTYYLSYGSAEDYKSFAVCDKTAEHSYQKYESLNAKSKTDFLAYNNKEKLEQFTKTICQQLLKNGSAADKKISDDEVAKAFIQIKSRTDSYFKKLNQRLEAIRNQLGAMERDSNFITRMSADHKNRKVSLESEYNRIIMHFK